MEKIHVKLNLPVNDITNLSWEEIINKANAHKISEKCIGQTKQLNIGGTMYDVRIIGVNHDDLSDGSGKANTTWQLVNCYNTTYPMNHPSSTNIGSWNASKMRTETMPMLLNLIQEDVRNAIVEVNKETLESSTSSTMQVSKDKLFLCSSCEIGGTNFAQSEDEGKQYEYWKQHDNNNDRKCGPQNDPTNYSNWWCRTLYTWNTEGFKYVSYTGIDNSTSAGNSLGVRFAFCI